MTMTRSSHTQSASEHLQTSRTPEAVQAVLAIADEEQLMEYGRQLADRGFTALRRYFEEIREYLRTFMDDEAADAAALIERLRTALPTPGRISPSWQDIWQEFSGIVKYKTEVLKRIPAAARDGEWQVLLDNPYSNQHIAVYPALTFQEASYMYAYFRTSLEPTEFIRLQKVETVIMNTGADKDE